MIDGSGSDVHSAVASRPLPNLIELKLELSDSLELDVKLSPHLVKTRPVFLEDLAARVQQVNHVIEFASRHVEATGLWNPGDRAVRASLECHRRGYERLSLYTY